MLKPVRSIYRDVRLRVQSAPHAVVDQRRCPDESAVAIVSPPSTQICTVIGGHPAERALPTQQHPVLRRTWCPESRIRRIF